MDELISRMIEIEEKAQSYMADAKRKKQTLETEVEKETRALEQSISQRAQVKCVSLKDFEEKDAKERVEKIRIKTEQSMDQLEKKYADNKERWVETIFNRVIRF